MNTNNEVNEQKKEISEIVTSFLDKKPLNEITKRDLTKLATAAYKAGTRKNAKWHHPGEKPLKYPLHTAGGFPYASILILTEKGSKTVSNVFKGEHLPPHTAAWLDIEDLNPPTEL